MTLRFSARWKGLSPAAQHQQGILTHIQTGSGCIPDGRQRVSSVFFFSKQPQPLSIVEPPHYFFHRKHFTTFWRSKPKGLVELCCGFAGLLSWRNRQARRYLQNLWVQRTRSWPPQRVNYIGPAHLQNKALEERAGGTIVGASVTGQDIYRGLS